MKIIDITLPIHEGMITYPGNPEVKITKHKGATSTHSEVVLGSHTGTHIDAPSHVFSRGRTLDGLAFSQLVGTCRVLDFSNVVNSIKIEDLKRHRIRPHERILVKTKNSERGFTEFRENYVFLDGDAAEYLAGIGILLFGIDALSIKKRGSEDVRPHTALLKKNIVILEGINLKSVKAGTYTLFCLPLKLEAADGAPVRAILTH